MAAPAVVPTAALPTRFARGAPAAVPGGSAPSCALRAHSPPTTGQSPSEFADEVRLLLAAKLYELGRISSEQAGKLCGRSRVDFLNALPRVSVAVSNLTPEDLEDDITYAKHG
ncbi:MAG: UPF0175 family protein [Polyangiaceae bacterium]